MQLGATCLKEYEKPLVCKQSAMKNLCLLGCLSCSSCEGTPRMPCAVQGTCSGGLRVLGPHMRQAGAPCGSSGG
eukprot:8196358-Lingulodinium_polyedra.AAC.1